MYDLSDQMNSKTLYDLIPSFNKRWFPFIALLKGFGRWFLPVSVLSLSEFISSVSKEEVRVKTLEPTLSSLMST